MPAPRCNPAVLAIIPWIALTPPREFSGRVVGVSDGDTITVLRDRTPLKVRLHGIACPESGQDFGSRAKAFTSELVFGRLVTLLPRDTDLYGRTVADVVLVDGRILNHELIRAGLAWWYRKYAPNIGTLAQLEAEARDARRGLWSQPNPVPPWEWRRTKDEARSGELTGAFIGNRRSRVDHRPGCPNAASIAPGHRAPFDSAEAAEAAGFRPGKDCLNR